MKGKEYLEKTESAAIKIFEGIDSYLQILTPPPLYHGNPKDSGYKKWRTANNSKIEAFRKIEREFLAEQFALATLCGSLLQISAMGIQWCSQNETIPEDLPEDLKSKCNNNKVAKFCVGRTVRKLPIGLIIYAGRNQFNHMNEKQLNQLNQTIFDILAKTYNNNTELSNPDPAFDLKSETLTNFSSNITHLLEWRKYESYYDDMCSLIVDS